MVVTQLSKIMTGILGTYITFDNAYTEMMVQDLKRVTAIKDIRFVGTPVDGTPGSDS